MEQVTQLIADHGDPRKAVLIYTALEKQRKSKGMRQHPGIPDFIKERKESLQGTMSDCDYSDLLKEGESLDFEEALIMCSEE